MPAPSWIDFYNQLTANAKKTTFARAVDNTAQIKWRYADEDKEQFGDSSKDGGIGGGSIWDKTWNNNNSAGKRVLDVLSRGAYASANFRKYQKEHESGKPGYNIIENTGHFLQDLGDIPGAVGAAWEGATGRSKVLSHDVNEGEIPGGIVGGVANFVEDVMLDPTTYIGGGAVRGVLKGGEKLTGVPAKLTETAVKPAAERAAEELVTTGKAVVPAKSADDFIRNVTRNAETPGNAFDNVVSTATEVSREALPGRVKVPDEPRLFVGDSAGQTAERFMLPGPSADVIANRAALAHTEGMAKGIPQFEYGRVVDELPDTGFFREEVTKVPITPKELRGKAPKTLKDVPEVDNPNLFRNAVLRAGDEIVYSGYEKVPMANGKFYYRPTEGAKEATVNELRHVIHNSGNEQLVAMAKQMLVGHLKAVEDYAKSVPEGYRSAEEFMKDTYPHTWKQAKASIAGKSSKGPEPLPEGPLSAMERKAAEPKFKEVRTYTKMSAADKFIFRITHASGLSDKDWAYLAQASNAKSYATRLNNLRNRVRAEGTRDLNDLKEAIKEGRIQSMEEPGLPELAEHLGAKSLKGVVQKIEQMEARLSKSEKKMLGIKEPGEVVTKATEEVGIPATKELGPTGLEYGAYTGAAKEALVKAQEIVATAEKPADAIVAAAKQGDKTPLMRSATTLDVNQSKIFDEALKLAVEHNVISPRNKELYAYVTRRGTLRTHATPNVGAGRNKGVWGKFPQYTFFKALMNNAEKIDPQIKAILDEAGIKGGDRSYARSSAMYDLMMPVLKSVDDVLKQGGVFPVAGNINADNAFSLFDILHALDPDFVKRNVFTLRKTKAGYSSVNAPTQLMDAFDYAVNAAKGGELGPDDYDTIASILMERQVTRNGKKVPNGWADRLDKINDVFKYEVEVGNVVSKIADAVPEVVQRTERNLADRKLYHENQVAKGTKKSLEELADRIVDPAMSPGDLTKLAANTDVVVKGVSRLHGIDEADQWMVQQEVNAATPELGLTPEAAAVGKITESITRATGNNAKVRAATKLAEQADTESAKLAEEMGISLSDMGTRFEHHWTYRMMQAFAPHLGNGAVRPLFLDRKSVSQNIARGYQALIGDIVTRHAKQDIMAAWKELQGGTKSTVPSIAKAQDDLQKAVNTLFSQDGAYNVFARNNVNAADVNSHFAHFRIHEKFRFTDDDLNDAWRTWDTEDPLDLLAKVQAATMLATSKRLLGEDLVSRFASKAPREGYVKLSSRNSVLAHYLDLEQYYPKDIARQFRILDNFMKDSMQPAKFNQMLNVLDNVLHSYKAGMTIYRPGHHIRNQIGDTWLAAMDGVVNPAVYTKSAKIMAQNHGRYRDFDAIAALQARQPHVVQGGKFVDDGSPMIHVRVNGKKTPLTGGDIYRAAYDTGILNDYRTLEDIQMGSESLHSQLNKISPFRGKFHKLAASTSEARDHYTRLAHFIDVLEKGNFRSLEDAFTSSGHRVRKWHPDGSDLTGFESKVMRRSVLFYSWIRKAIPLVIESMVMHPGRVMVYPKAMYNIAEAQGINLDSMSNPFPQDQLFPDWITDSVTGPVTQTDDKHYLGVNPGVPFVDVLNDYAGSQAKRTALGAINPMAKIPIELTAKPDAAVAQDLRTGINSYDRSDYIDRQIPGASYVANITGRSPSSGFLQAKGNAEESEMSGTPLFNLLTGLGLMDMSKPSYQRGAREDAKKRYRQQQGGK